MIVTEDGPSSPMKADSQTPVSPTATTPFYVLPREPEREPLMTPPPPPYRATPIPGSAAAAARRRFFRALAAGICIYAAVSIILGTTIRGIVQVIRRNRGGDSGEPGRLPRLPKGPSSAPNPIPSDGEVVQCDLPLTPYDKGPIYTVADDPAYHGVFELDMLNDSYLVKQRPPFASITSFELPKDTPLVYFVSRVGRAKGTIKFLPAPDGADKVYGQVITRYSTILERSRVNYCIVKRDEQAYGIGLYTSLDNSRWFNPLVLEVTVYVPVSKALNDRLSIETSMSLFNHEFGDFHGMRFNHIDILSVLGGLRAKALIAHSIVARTDSASISGRFHVKESLNLATTNAFIQAKVIADNSDWHSPATIAMTTSNSRIEAEIMLENSDEAPEHYNEVGLRAEVATTNGRLNITIPSAPVGSHLQLNAATTNGDAYTALPDTFEGLLMLMDRNGKMRVFNDQATPDPAGQGRKRAYHAQLVNSESVVGRVFWGPENDYRECGTVVISTTNGVNSADLL